MNEQESLEIPYSPSASNSKLGTFLSHLVFKEHGMRIGLELVGIFFIHILLIASLPWGAMQIASGLAPLYAWFLACGAMIMIDRSLCYPAYLFKISCSYDLAGDYKKALYFINKLGPQSATLIRLPLANWHLKRAEIFSHQSNFTDAHAELDGAKYAGLDSELYIGKKAALLREEKRFEDARELLHSAYTTHGETASLKIEEALTFVEERKELWQAKRIFKSVMQLPPIALLNGDFSSNCARAYFEVLRLWTGEAEEGLEGLSDVFSRYISLTSSIDSLRPLVSKLFLERARYFATHKEPESAIQDLKQALLLCLYPTHQRLAEEVKSEIFERHSISVS